MMIYITIDTRPKKIGPTIHSNMKEFHKLPIPKSEKIAKIKNVIHSKYSFLKFAIKFRKF